MVFTDIPFRIRIGVTGHRILKDPEKIAARVRDVLKNRVAELFDQPLSPGSLQTRLVFSVLTPLAEGADRLVAREVLAFPDSEIEVVLPLSREDYFQDFETEESKREFDGFYNRASNRMLLRTHRLADTVAAVDLAEARKIAYEDVGRYVVTHCDLLIALWDGKPSCGRGGTAEIIAYARGKQLPLVIISTENPDQIHIEKGSGLSSRSYRRLHMFNRFPITEATHQSYVERAFQRLFRNPEGETLSAELKKKIKDKLLPFYVRASLIAKQNQIRYLRTGLLVYCFSPLAVAAVMLGVLVSGISTLAFSLELGLLLFILIIISLADRSKVHKKWIEGRFLTERLRSAIFLATCGIRSAAIAVPSFMRMSLKTEEWLIRVFSEIERGMGDLAECRQAECLPCRQYIAKHWLQDQIDFHSRKAVKMGRISHGLETSGKIVFLSAMAAVALHLALFFLGQDSILAVSEKPIIFLAVVLPAVGAAVGAIRTHREFSRLEKRSQNMEAALSDLQNRFSAVTRVEEMSILLRQVEDVVLQEAQDWLMLMKFVKVEPV